MKERPILFSGPMVRALLGGRKTQTRRAVKGVTVHGPDDRGFFDVYRGDDLRDWRGAFGKDGRGNATKLCPYGVPGDRLWVRESGWERPPVTAKMMREGADTWPPYYYDADGISGQDAADFKTWGFKRRPSIFMPRGASRITLELAGVRIERLQEISESDVTAEGCEVRNFWLFGLNGEERRHVAAGVYRDLWDSINGAGSWEANPWVWVLTFRHAIGRDS